jgi:hypothetical protein
MISLQKQRSDPFTKRYYICLIKMNDSCINKNENCLLFRKFNILCSPPLFLSVIWQCCQVAVATAK